MLQPPQSLHLVKTNNTGSGSRYSTDNSPESRIPTGDSARLSSSGMHQSGGYMFDNVTEFTAPSLDAQVGRYESGVEADLYSMLDSLYRRVNDDAEVEAAKAKLKSMPKIDFNPYRPPRGAHVREQLQEMHVVEWGEVSYACLTLVGTASKIERKGDDSGPSSSRPGSARRTPGQLSAMTPTSRRGSTGSVGTVFPAPSFDVDVEDAVLSITGIPVRCPPHPVVRLAALGGVEEEIVASHKDGEEYFAVDRRPVPPQTAAQVQKRADLGFPPVSPRACAVEEVEHLLFVSLWNDLAVPLLLSRTSPIAEPLPTSSTPKSGHEVGKQAKGAKKAKKPKNGQPSKKSSKKNSGTPSSANAAIPTTPDANQANGKVKQYLEELEMNRNKADLERIPTPTLSELPPLQGANHTSAFRSVDAQQRRPFSTTESGPGGPRKHLTSAALQEHNQRKSECELVLDEPEPLNKTALPAIDIKPRPFVRAQTAKPGPTNGKQGNGRRPMQGPIG